MSPRSVTRLDVLREQADRTLSEDEVDAYLAHVMTAEEEAELRSLIAWFRRRYPTALARLEYVRRAYRRWTGNAVRSPRFLALAGSAADFPDAPDSPPDEGPDFDG